MKILFKLLGRAGDLADIQPLLALFLGGALIAVFLSVLLRAKPASGPGLGPNWFWMLYQQSQRLLWALMLVSFVVAAFSLLRTYLHRTVADFERTHGRITQANYNAVQTIWGAEQSQADLGMELYYEEEVTERIESEDPTKPALLRKKIVRHNIASNPFMSARHDVTLRQNPRKKGSAYYTGYETACRFSWRLKNPTDRDLKSVLTFPLPAAGAMYNDLIATLNGQDILPQMQLANASLVLTRDVKPNETLDLNISFTSRGMSFWYFQVKEPRQVRDFTLTLNLPDLPKAKLNYPSDCMTPTDIKPAKDGAGCVLTYRLDSAISNKGMGISLPSLAQPGETTSAVLGEIERGWLMIFALLTLGLSFAPVRRAALVIILLATATACAYGLFGDFNDLLFGFWGTAALALLPMFLLLAWLLTRIVPGIGGKFLGGQMLLFGIFYPCLAGLDDDRQPLYFNLCAVVFLAWTTWLLMKNSATTTENAPVAA